jgi:hypothetical protein
VLAIPLLYKAFRAKAKAKVGCEVRGKVARLEFLF